MIASPTILNGTWKRRDAECALEALLGLRSVASLDPEVLHAVGFLRSFNLRAGDAWNVVHAVRAEPSPRGHPDLTDAGLAAFSRCMQYFVSDVIEDNCHYWY